MGKKHWYDDREMDMESAKQKKKEIEKRNEGIFHEIRQKKGSYVANYYYVMPSWRTKGKRDCWREVWRHKIYVCPYRMLKKKCVICDEIRKQDKLGNTDFGREWAARPTGYVNAIRKEDIAKKSLDCLKVLRLSKVLFEQLVDHVNDEDDDISNPKKAVPICIKRKGINLETDYRDMTFGKAVDIRKYLTKEIGESLFDLDTAAFVQPASKKDMIKAIKGAADEDEDEDEFIDDEEEDEEEDLQEPDDDEEEELDEDEDEDEDDDSDDSDDEEEEEEDDDLSEFEDDDEEEEEEEPPPKKSKKTKRSKTKTDKGKKGKDKVRKADKKRR